jgi:hypothetical protein
VKSSMFPKKESYSQEKYNIVLGQLMSNRKEVHRLKKVLKKFRALSNSRKPVRLYKGTKSKLVRLSAAQRREFHRKAEIISYQIVMTAKLDGYAKSGGGVEFRTIKSVTQSARNIARELLKLSSKTNLTDALVQLTKRTIASHPTIKRCYIPKKGEVNGQRPLGVPPHTVKQIEYIWSVRLDEFLKSQLRYVADNGSTVSLHGYVKGSKTQDARDEILKAITCMNPDESILNGDQSGAFDAMLATMRKQMLQFHQPKCWEALELLAGREVSAKEGAVIGAGNVALSVHTPTEEYYLKKYSNGKAIYQRNTKGNGTPQGGVISPKVYLLAQMDIYRQLADKFSNITIIGYADDVVIIGKTELMDSIKASLMTMSSHVGFQVNASKTYISKDNANFLGWSISKAGWCTDMNQYLSRRKGVDSVVSEVLKYSSMPNYSECPEAQEMANKVIKEYLDKRYRNVLNSSIKPTAETLEKLQIDTAIKLGVLRYYAGTSFSTKDYPELNRVATNPFADKLCRQSKCGKADAMLLTHIPLNSPELKELLSELVNSKESNTIAIEVDKTIFYKEETAKIMMGFDLSMFS